MKPAIEWFVRNQVAANLLMIMIFVAGTMSVLQIKTEVFPEFSMDTISVSVLYLGAAPEEVEEGVCIKIEEAIQDLDGIKKITSTASEGMGTVSIEVKDGFDIQRLLDDVKSRVDAIATFPEQTEKPVIQEVLNKRQVLNIAVTGNTDEHSLKLIAKQLRDEIINLPDVSQAELTAARDYEIAIEVSETALERYNMTFSEVADAVRMSSIDLPGGSLKTSGGELSIRTNGQAYRGSEYENLILRSLPDGTRLRLKDVATVVDGFAETDLAARFDGTPAILVQVFRVGDENVLDVANSVKEYIKIAQQRLPEGIDLIPWQDDSLIFKDRLNLLVRNGRTGFLLVFLALALFLKLRLAWWVTAGMIMSFFGAFWIMPMYDVSVNMISMFAFILVLGIVVDDAIVVGENIYSKYEEGMDGVRAAITGTKEVAVPVTFAIFTTVAAFSPLLFVTGMMGKIMFVVPIIVISTLLFSLIESVFILPAHLSHIEKRKKEGKGSRIVTLWSGIQTNFHDKLLNVSNTYYRKTLDTLLEWKFMTAAVSVGILILTISIIAGGWIKFVFMPEVEADNIVALVTMPQGTPLEVTERTVQQLERSAQKIIEEFTIDGESPVTHILTTVGDQPFLARGMGGPAGGASGNNPHIGEVNIQLVSAELRRTNSVDMAVRWRELSGIIPEAEELSFSSSLFSAGDPINIQLSGADYEALVSAAEELKILIGEYPGVFDISDSYRAGKGEIKLNITPEAEALGLTLSSVAMQVRQAFYGEEAQRIQRGRDEIRVMVRYPEEDRTSISDLEKMKIRVPGGGEVPFKTAAVMDLGTGFSSISRTDRKRTINVTADVDISIANANEIVSDITKRVMPQFLIEHPGITYSLEGEQNEQRESFEGLAQGYVLALIIIYILLAIPFSSYVQPLIIMSAIPFGLIGAVGGHILLGYNLTMISMFGIVALAGVVVNDSLVLVDFINRSRSSDLPLKQVIINAGQKRFRPIMLTSLTTFAGLTPLLLEQSMQAQFLIPMAISLAFGVLFATAITLVIVPVFYSIMEDIRSAFTR